MILSKETNQSSNDVENQSISSIFQFNILLKMVISWIWKTIITVILLYRVQSISPSQNLAYSLASFAPNCIWFWNCFCNGLVLTHQFSWLKLIKFAFCEWLVPNNPVIQTEHLNDSISLNLSSVENAHTERNTSERE